MTQLRSMAAALCAVLSLILGHASAAEEGLSALARPDLEQSEIGDLGNNLQITLTLSQPVPWRIFTLDGPPRLVIDFSVVDWGGVDIDQVIDSDFVAGVVTGPFRDDWSRLVLSLAQPMELETAGLITGETGGAATLKVQMAPTSAEKFAAQAGAPEGAKMILPPAADLPEPRPRQTGERPLVVVLDPGHGGIDPGAEAGDIDEADVMLTFARDLRDALLRTGGFEVVMTREDDTFVPLETRITIARAARADVFLSLHADALAEGRASGATVYTLSDEASNDASRLLAERHDRADLLAGLDLSRQDDVIAGVLMDMARLNTRPRSERLAVDLVQGLGEATHDMHKRPRLHAGFSVLKAPDMPSALVELGFLSSERDRRNLLDPAWRARAAAGIVNALTRWKEADAAEARALLRQ